MSSSSSKRPRTPCKEKLNKIPKSPKQQNSQHAKFDTFCWICHKKSVPLVIFCPMCVRSYHYHCIQNDYTALHWQCSECRKLEAARKTSYISTDRLYQMLNIVYKRLDWKKFDPVLDTSLQVDSAEIFNAMDLHQIKRNIENRKYETTAHFLADIKWIFHNCLIIESSASQKKVTKELLQFCENDINHINACDECFEYAVAANYSNFFSKVCSRKHPLVWAKVSGYPYFPAKLMTVNAGMVDVHFFGEHNTALISEKFCLGFSKEDPNKIVRQNTSRHISQQKLIAIMKEVNQYIENLKKAGGLFEYKKVGEKCDIPSMNCQSNNQASNLTQTRKETISVVTPSNMEPMVSLPILEDEMENGENDSNSALFNIKDEITPLLDKHVQILKSLENDLMNEKLKNKKLSKELNDEKNRIKVNLSRSLETNLNNEKLKNKKLLKEINDERHRCIAEQLKNEKLLKELNEEKRLKVSELNQERTKYEQMINEIKQKKWCTICNVESKLLPNMPIFCSVNCNAKWQVDHMNSTN